MDRERLSRLLEEPGKVAREDLADLKALTEQFPWFSGAHLLRAIGERRSGDVMADETLKVSAAHVPSRAVLFDLRDITLEQAANQLKLVRTEFPQEGEEQAGTEGSTAPLSTPMDAGVPMPEEDHATSIRAEEENDPIASMGVEQQAEIEKPIAGTVGEIGPPLISEKEEEEMPSAEEIGTDPSEEKDQVREALDRQILEAALASAYDLTWQEEIRTPIVPPKKEPRASLSAHLSTERIDRPIEASQEPIIEPTIPANADPKPALTVRSKLKFTDWITMGNDTTDQVGSDRSEERTIVQHGSKAEGSDPINAKPIDPVDPATLIDRFIEHETPPPSRKAEFFTPQQAAKKSLDDTAGLVSETLAKIYEKQGNFQKAIDAYRKLALKYPEKSAYFAALSKTLEGKLNS